MSTHNTLSCLFVITLFLYPAQYHDRSFYFGFLGDKVHLELLVNE